MLTKTNDFIYTADALDDITPEVVQWLKDGCTRRGCYLHNERAICYRTARGIAKDMTCYVYPDGSVKWRSFTARGNTHDGLTTEEARVFSPDLYARRMSRKESDKAAAKSAMQGFNVKPGDIFGGSYGYDATLWNFYEVVAVSKTGKTVTVRELAHETAAGYGFNDWKCRPIPGKYIGACERHTVKCYRGGAPYFSVASYESAYLLADPTAWHDADNYH